MISCNLNEAGYFVWRIYDETRAKVQEIIDGSETSGKRYYGLFSREYGPKTFSSISLFGSKLINGVPVPADLQGKAFYASVGGVAPIQQKFASFPYGERAPWQWLLNGKKGMSIEFYYHDEAIDDVFYEPVNTNIHYQPYTSVEPDERASVRDRGGDYKVMFDENGNPDVEPVSYRFQYEKISDAEREASVKKLQQVVIDIEIL